MQFPTEQCKTRSDKPTQSHAAAMPHERDETPQSQQAGQRIKQAYKDIQAERMDTDRRGGREYQKKIQNDSQANINSQALEANGL